MLEKLGSKKYAVPAVAAIVIACVMSVLFYPMAHMEIKGLPFAVLSLDEGAQTAQGHVNAGEAMVEGLMSATEAGDGEQAIVWTEVSSQEELDEALENNEYYGAIVIPEDYTAKRVEAQQAEMQATLAQAQALQAAQAAAGAQAEAGASASAATGQSGGSETAASAASGLSASASDDATDVEAPAIKVIVDNAKSPLIANQMKTSLSSMFLEMGVEADVEVIHEGVAASDAGDAADDGSSSRTAANPMSGMLVLQVSIMPLFIMSMVASVLISRLFPLRRGDASAARAKMLCTQALSAAAASLVVSLCVFAIMLWAMSIEVPAAEYVLFAWLASFCLMVLFAGVMNVAFPAGVLVAVAILAFGTMTGALPFEVMPEFWRDWVCPWVPQYFLGEGLRSILYMGGSAWNSASPMLLAYAAVGIACAGVSTVLPVRK